MSVVKPHSKYHDTFEDKNDGFEVDDTCVQINDACRILICNRGVEQHNRYIAMQTQYEMTQSPNYDAIEANVTHLFFDFD